jgi:predicted ATP-grasp superfamily ATP-dependent carboligase
MGNTNLVRALGLAGISSTPVARADSPTAYSRFVDERVDWADNWGDGPGMLRNLLAFAERQPAPPVLFYQHDGDLVFVSRHRDELRPAFRFVIASRDRVDQLVDKTQFAVLATTRGLPVPPSVVVVPGFEREVPELPLEFPVILKPLTRRDLLWRPLAGKAKALRVDSQRRLAELWPRLVEADIELVAQELIAGGEERIESYHVYVDERGEVAGEFTGRKIRTLPATYGETTALEITDEGDVREIGRHCVSELGLRGVAKLDFKRDPSGRLFLLEVNARFNLWHLPGAVAGVNLPALVYADLADLPRPPAGPARAGVTWSVPWFDLAAARRARTSLPRWLAWQARCDTRHVMALDDPMPFVRGMLMRRARNRLRRR